MSQEYTPVLLRIGATLEPESTSVPPPGTPIESVAPISVQQQAPVSPRQVIANLDATIDPNAQAAARITLSGHD